MDSSSREDRLRHHLRPAKWRCRSKIDLNLFSHGKIYEVICFCCTPMSVRHLSVSLYISFRMFHFSRSFYLAFHDASRKHLHLSLFSFSVIAFISFTFTSFDCWWKEKLYPHNIWTEYVDVSFRYLSFSQFLSLSLGRSIVASFQPNLRFLRSVKLI